MTEKTPLQPENAVAHFFGDKTVFELIGFGQGNINDTWKLTISKNGQPQSYLLQRLNHLVFRQPDQVMANISNVAQHLAAKKYTSGILHPCAAPEGHVLFCDDAGNHWRVFPFFERTTTLETVNSPEQAFIAAQAFGVFLEALSDLNPAALHETIPGFHNSVARLAVFQEGVARDTANRLAGVQSEVDFVLKESSIFHTIANLGLPLRAVHNDAKIGNVLLDEQAEKAVAVIDWDTIMPGYLLSDLGDIARTMAASCSEDEADPAKVTFRMPVFAAICRGFLPPLQHILTTAEREALYLAPRWIILEQAMRFLGDYLAGDVYYKIRHPLHNLERARNQLALYRSVLEQQVAVREAVGMQNL
jgi:aminoglycoside phosphotransferase (APT) family kinase protein